MDKIYTRKRIKLPNVKCLKFQNGRPKKKAILELILIVAIAILTFMIVINSIEPIIDKICEDVAKSKATIVSNNVATEVMQKYNYEDLINISKDSNGNISLIQSNIITINEITSDIAVKLQKAFLEDTKSEYKVKLR